VGRDSVVGIATRFGLDGPEIEFNWGGGVIFRSRPDCPGVHPASYTVGTGSLPGVERRGHGFATHPLSSAKVKERVGLYIYSRSGPSWPVLG
jgi:hypothetical protein